MELAVLAEDLSKIPTDAGDAIGQKSITVSDDVFSLDFNEALVHQVVIAYLAGARSGTRAQKNRSDVRGGGAKPYRQKGTGRARAGSIRSPLWRGGGVTFAARPKNHAQKLNRKMYRGALCSIVSELIRQDRFMIVSEFNVSSPKTSEVVVQLQKLGLTNVLIVTDQKQNNLELAVRNLRWAESLDVSKVNPVSLIEYEKILITVSGLRKLEEGLQ